MWSGLVGWGTHHILMPLVSDCTVHSSVKPAKEEEKKSPREKIAQKTPGLENYD